MAEALWTVQKLRRGLLRGLWWPVGPKLVLTRWQHQSQLWTWIVTCPFCPPLILPIIIITFLHISNTFTCTARCSIYRIKEKSLKHK
jgi:hypothetical protein